MNNLTVLENMFGECEAFADQYISKHGGEKIAVNADGRLFHYVVFIDGIFIDARNDPSDDVCEFLYVLREWYLENDKELSLNEDSLDMEYDE